MRAKKPLEREDISTKIRPEPRPTPKNLVKLQKIEKTEKVLNQQKNKKHNNLAKNGDANATRKTKKLAKIKDQIASKVAAKGKAKKPKKSVK